MGYYSNLAIDYVDYDHDCSYTPPEQQLLWRLEDLQDRLEELTVKRRIFGSGVTFSEDDLRYVLPQHFMTVADVEAAITLAIHDLKERYGISEEIPEEAPLLDELTGMQVSFLDILPVCTRSNPLSAA